MNEDELKDWYVEKFNQVVENGERISELEKKVKEMSWNLTPASATAVITKELSELKDQIDDLPNYPDVNILEGDIAQISKEVNELEKMFNQLQEDLNYKEEELSDLEKKVDEEIRNAALMVVGNWDENRKELSELKDQVDFKDTKLNTLYSNFEELKEDYNEKKMMFIIARTAEESWLRSDFIKLKRTLEIRTEAIQHIRNQQALLRGDFKKYRNAEIQELIAKQEQLREIVQFWISRYPLKQKKIIKRLKEWLGHD